MGVGIKIFFRPLLGKGHKIKCQIFLGDRGNRLHFGKMLLASGGCRPPDPLIYIYMCYIYGCHFIISLFYLL